MSGSFRPATGGAQVDRTFQRSFKEGSFNLGEADHRAGWALLSGILDTRAGGLEVGVVEELGVRESDLHLGDIGFAGIGCEDGEQSWVASMFGGAREADGELGGEGEVAAVGGLEMGGGFGQGAFGAKYFGFDGEGVAVGRVEREVQGG